MRHRMQAFATLVFFALALFVVGCRNENAATPTPGASTTPATSTAPPDARAPASGLPIESADTRPIVDMRGCIVLASAREKADEVERARVDCPTKLHEEKRRENKKDVMYSFKLNQPRTDDVRVRAVPNVCCYDKSPLSSP
jgi:hypothetical protein